MEMKKEHLKSETAIDRIRFLKSNGHTISVDYKPNWTVRYAINNAGESLKKFSFEDHILFAELNDSPSDCSNEFAITADILCSHLKRGGKVRSKLKKKANKQRSLDDNEEDIHDKTPNKQILFYANSTTPFGRAATKIKNSTYEGKPLCVIAYEGEKLMDAVLKDGRFSDELELYENDATKTSISHQYLASDHAGEVFNAIVTKKPKKRKSDEEADQGDESSNAPQRKKSVYSTLPSRLNDEFTDEIRKEMIQDARIHASETFGDAGKDTDQRIKYMVGKFGKMDSAKGPTRVLPKLAEASKSVGFIRCGDVTGTCFLLRQNAIITCQHVINNIHTKRSQSTDPELFRKIFVHFEYDYPNEFGARVEIDGTKTPVYGRGNLDYAIMFLKSSPNGNLTPLGSWVRSVVPCSGEVILIGHPDNHDKRFEICSIMPPHKFHATLFQRASEAEQYCTGEHVDCVHMYAGRLAKGPGEHADELPYDTSFFEGSSGSPVFNTDGHIIAMHTQGYPFMQNSKKCSLMEFGVTFSAIYRDVKEWYSDSIAKCLFPSCGEEEMNDPPVSQGLRSTMPPNPR